MGLTIFALCNSYEQKKQKKIPYDIHFQIKDIL